MSDTNGSELKRKQEVFGYSHNHHATTVPLSTSCQAHWYSDSSSSQLGETTVNSSLSAACIPNSSTLTSLMQKWPLQTLRMSLLWPWRSHPPELWGVYFWCFWMTPSMASSYSSSEALRPVTSFMFSWVQIRLSLIIFEGKWERGRKPGLQVWPELESWLCFSVTEGFWNKDLISTLSFSFGGIA